MLTLRYKRSLILYQFIFLLIPLTLMGLVGYFGFTLSFDVGKPFSSIMGCITGIFVLFCLLISVWLGVNLYATWNARLILDKTSFQLKSLKKQGRFIPFSGRSFSVEYTNISLIKVKSIGLIEIIEQQETTSNIIALSFFDKHSSEQILNWLYDHIPTAKIEPDLRNRLNQRQKLTATELVPIYIFLALILFFAISDIGFFRSRLTHAWTREHNFQIFEHARKVQVDNSQSGLWVLTHGTRNRYFIYQYKDEDISEWKLPDKTPGNEPLLISHNETGLPIIWFESGVIYFESEWKSNTYSSNLVIGSFELKNGVASNNKAWAVIKIENLYNLVELDAFTGSWDIVQLPETATQKGYSPSLIWPTMYGKVLVLMSNEESATIYLWSGQEWEPQEYPVNISVDFFPSDCFLDSNDNLWALYSSFLSKEYHIQKITPNRTFQTTKLPENEQNHHRYESLLVDSHERIWVSGGYPSFMEAFSPVWDGYAKSLMKYTKENSNFDDDFSSKPVMSSDGIIWSSNDGISFINSSVDELPLPLPDWFVWASDRTGRLYLYSFIFIYILYFRWKGNRVTKGKMQVQ